MLEPLCDSGFDVGCKFNKVEKISDNGIHRKRNV